MAGWRIGMAVGNARIVDALMRVKSNLDSGIPQAIQQMAIAALDGPQDCIAENNAIYTFATRLLDEAGVVVTPGIGYGPSGEGYVRLSLTIADDRLEEGVRRMEKLAATWR